MKTLAGIVLFASAFALGVQAETLTGTISDEHCGAKHAAGTDADSACVKKCMQGGAAAVFVSGDKVFKIENPDAIKGHEGQKVSIDGKVTGDAVHIDNLKMMAAAR